MRTLAALATVVVVAGCSAAPEPGPRVVTAATGDERKALWDPLVALAGEWTTKAQDGRDVTALRVKVTSGGATIQEAIFPDGEGEMVNLYTLDGASVVMTHYCHVGNQPRMRATRNDGGKFEFRSDGCGNLTSADGGYMGSMTLVIRDADHIEQSWFWHEKGTISPGPVIVLVRKK